MDTMTSRERLLAAIKRQQVDNVPCSPFFNPQDYVQRIGKTYNFPFGPSRDETVTYFVEQHGLDMVASVPWQKAFPSGVSATMAYDAPLLTKTWSTPSGEISATIRYDENWPYGYDIPFYTDYALSKFVKPWLETEHDVECFRHMLAPPSKKEHIDRLRFGWDVTKRLADKYQLATMASLGMGLTAMQQLTGATQLCMMVLDNPDLVDAYLEIEHENTLKNYEIALDFGVDHIRRNGFYESADFYSPALLEQFLKRRINEEAKLVHDAGATIGYTILTGYTPILDYFSSLDLDCVMTPDPFFRNESPEALRDACSDHMSFWTGPSDTVQMPWDDQEVIEQAVEQTFEIFGKTGLIIAACSSAKAVHPWANIVRMIETWKRLR